MICWPIGIKGHRIYPQCVAIPDRPDADLPGKLLDDCDEATDLDVVGVFEALEGCDRKLASSNWETTACSLLPSPVVLTPVIFKLRLAVEEESGGNSEGIAEQLSCGARKLLAPVDRWDSTRWSESLGLAELVKLVEMAKSGLNPVPIRSLERGEFEGN